MLSLPPANEVCEGYVFTGICDSVNRGGHVWLLTGGGMHGCSWGGAWLLKGGHAWLLTGGRGACMVAKGGGMHACSQGGMHACSQGGMHACSRGGMRACSGGACMFFFLNEVRSMSGRYASYWNAFLLFYVLTLLFLQKEVQPSERSPEDTFRNIANLKCEFLPLGGASLVMSFLFIRCLRYERRYFFW